MNETSGAGQMEPSEEPGVAWSSSEKPAWDSLVLIVEEGIQAQLGEVVLTGQMPAGRHAIWRKMYLVR